MFTHFLISFNFAIRMDLVKGKQAYRWFETVNSFTAPSAPSRLWKCLDEVLPISKCNFRSDCSVMDMYVCTLCVPSKCIHCKLKAKQSIELVSTSPPSALTGSIKTQIIYMLVSSKAAPRPLISTESFHRSECSGCISKSDVLTFATAKKCD